MVNIHALSTYFFLVYLIEILHPIADHPGLPYVIFQLFQIIKNSFHEATKFGDQDI